MDYVVVIMNSTSTNWYHSTATSNAAITTREVEAGLLLYYANPQWGRLLENAHPYIFIILITHIHTLTYLSCGIQFPIPLVNLFQIVAILKKKQPHHPCTQQPSLWSCQSFLSAKKHQKHDCNNNLHNVFGILLSRSLPRAERTFSA